VYPRAVLIRNQVPSTTGHWYLVIEVAVCMIVGVIIFRRFAPRAAEYV